MKKSIIFISICLLLILSCVSTGNRQVTQALPESGPAPTPERMVIPDSLPAKPDPTAPPEPAKTPEPTGTPEPAQLPAEPGTVRIALSRSHINTGETVQARLMLNSGDKIVAAYGFDVNYNPAVLSIPEVNAVAAGKQGYVTAVNTRIPGIISIAGFNVNGVGPGADLEMVIINFQGVAAGTDMITVLVKNLTDLQYETIGKPAGVGAAISVAGSNS